METATERAANFLSRWDIRLEDLLGYIRPVKDTETVLLVGSITDGLANQLSDIDLLFIGDGELGEGFVQRGHGSEEAENKLPGGQQINLEYWQADALEKIRERLSVNLDLIRNPSSRAGGGINKFNISELRLLHRIRTGVALTNGELADHWRERLRLEELAGYLLLMGIGMHFIYREDAIAQVEYEGDALAACSMLHLAAECIASAMIASAGETNPYRKWQTRLLQRNAALLGEERVSELLRYLFPNPQEDAATQLRNALLFFDTSIVEVLGRFPAALPVLLEMDGMVSFVRNFEGLPPE